MGDLLNRRISNVGLSVRTYHALEAGGILTVRDLCSRSEADVTPAGQMNPEILIRKMWRP